MLVNTTSTYSWADHHIKNEHLGGCQKPRFTPPDTYVRGDQLRKHLIEVTADILDTLFECEKDTTYKGIPLREFIARITMKSQIPINNILCALLYLVRLKQRHPACKGVSGSGNRLFLAALIVGNKFLYDNAYLNSSWVPITDGLFTVREINLMEFELLYFLNFRLHVTKDQWVNFVQLIDRRVTESWRRTGDVVPDRVLYTKATSGADDPLGARGRLPACMTARVNHHMRERRRSVSPAESFSSYDSSPRTPNL
ncbi:hypothetical protein K493DRAFT_317984 [Basidiobolus meristosporus CBS 931.73]|uniref:Cyclin N-terminal domain-containing protein n=1 Tax=Basidiobolus meristosporus CBS 931.73 TaxID=1314790 RepID=A0A1Y1XY58_9FUNG|nr:hypothetical protein K493DRAFT_317984 [Basidiobolus meristosporus CBS 931.73]|eukprot:ORX90416.1 hypothetical protein K493DRAFT_317984 [Basidiobolus meristosporus CBS 931.73]